MVDVSNAPLASSTWSGNVRMGDPEPAPNQDPRLFVLAYPYPQGPTPTWASWPIGATDWQASPVIDDSCLFQVSEHKTALHAERAGPLDWLLITGLF